MRRIWLAAPLVLIWGCFNPSYEGEGGFSCKRSNVCPEGFTCVGGLCVREGTVLDGTVDGPSPDGPSPDGPLADAPPTEGPLADGPPTEGPLADASLADGPLADAPLPDAPLPDAPLPDAPLPDTLLPDGLLPDLGAPPCGVSKTASQGVTSTLNRIDIALDGKGQPHAFFVDGTGVMRHLWRVPTGAWSTEMVATGYQADRLAAVIDSNGVLYVVFRNPSDNSRPYMTYRQALASSWVQPVKINSKDELGDGLDMAARGAVVYISADRNSTTNGSDFYLLRVDKTQNPYGFKTIWIQSTASKKYSFGRLAAGSTQIATSVFDGTKHVLQSSPVGGSSINGKTLNAVIAAPMPVLVDGAGWILAGHANIVGGPLLYKRWDGKLLSSVTTDSLTGSTADPFVLDIAEGGPGVIYYVYRDTSASTPQLRMISRTATAWGTSTLAASVKADDVRMAIDLPLKQAWIVYSAATKLTVTCLQL